MHNPKLADKQNIDTTTREIIDNLHILRDHIVKDSVNHINLSNNTGQNVHNYHIIRVRDLYTTWFRNELLLQRLWKFKYNPSYIRFWDFPGCNCPVSDNEDRYPHGNYIISSKCMVHGDRN